MADKANSLYKQLIETTNQLTASQKRLQTQVKSNIETNKQLEAQLKGATGAKQLATAQKELQGNIKATATAEKEAIKVQQELEKLEQQRIRTASAQSKEKARLARETQKLNSLYKQESARLTDLRNKAKNVALQFGVASKQFRTAAAEVTKLDSKLKKIDSRLGQSGRFVGQYGKAWGGITRVLGAAGFAGGLFTAVAAIKSAGKQIRQFGKQSAILAGVLGKTRDEVKELTDDAKRLGSQTAKTSNDVLLLQTAYARLGFSQQEILDLTGDTINGSIALNAELEDTAELTGAVVRSFDEFSSTDAGKILDQLTLSTQKTALNFEKLQTAIPTVAGAAAAAGVPFKTMIAQLGQAADRGIEASTAATSLRNIYIELSKKGITLEQALKKINTSQDRLSTANKLFGKRAAVTALALASTTDKTKELESALDNAGGTAKKVADTQLKTLDGRLTLLSSAWQGFIDSLDSGDSALGNFFNRAIVSITDFLKLITNLGGSFDLVFKDITKLDRSSLDLALSMVKLEQTGETLGEALDVLNDLYSHAGGLTIDNVDAQKIWVQWMTESGQTVQEANVIYNHYVSRLAETEKAQDLATGSVQKTTESIEEEEAAITDLIEIQKVLLKQAKQLPGITEQEVTARNDKVAVIEKEIKRLQELRTLNKEEVTAIEGRKDIIIETNGEIDTSLKESTFNHDREERLKTKITEEQEQKRSEIRQQFTEAIKQSVVDAGNALFDIKLSQLDDETEAIKTSFDDRLSNELLDDEQRSLIEAERTAEENRIAKERRDIEKKQFLFNQGVKIAEIAMNTAQGISAAVAAFPLTGGLPWSAIVAVTGAIQTATVLAQTIPAFDKGTKSTPKDYIGGEKRDEFRVDKKGNVSLITQPTLFQNDAGSTIIGGAETSRIMDQITRQQVIEGVSMHSDSVHDRMLALAIDKATSKLGDRIVSELKKKPQQSDPDMAYIRTRDKYRS